MPGVIKSEWRERMRASGRLSWRALAGYLAYTVIAFLVFLAWTFPYQRVEKAIIAEVARRTGSEITTDAGRFVFPAGFVWHGVRVRPKSWENQTLDLDMIRASVVVPSLLRRTLEIDLAWDAYGGKVRGTWVARREAGGTRVSFDQFGQGFDLGRFPLRSTAKWQGTAQIELADQWTNDAWLAGDGTGSIEVTGLKVDHVEIGGFPIQGIEFDAVSARAALKGGTLTIQKLNARGPLGTALGEGTAMLRTPWTESVLSFSVTVNPSADAASRIPLLALANSASGPITIRVTGRVAKPDVFVNGVPVL